MVATPNSVFFLQILIFSSPSRCDFGCDKRKFTR